MINFILKKQADKTWLKFSGRCATDCVEPCEECVAQSVAFSNWLRFARVNKVVLDFQETYRPNLGALKEIMAQLRRSRTEAVFCNLDRRTIRELDSMGGCVPNVKLRREFGDPSSSSTVHQEMNYVSGEPLPVVPPHLGRSGTPNARVGQS